MGVGTLAAGVRKGVGQANVTTSTNATRITLGNAGGNQAFDNRQASLALLYCRKS